MSLVEFQAAFGHIEACHAWQLQLLKVITRRDTTRYAARAITLSPEGKLTEFVGLLAEQYMSPERGRLQAYSSLCDYDGTADGATIYRLSAENQLIQDEYNALIAATSTPEVESDPLGFSAQAYVLQGDVTIGDEDVSVKLISMQSPIVNLKQKFLYDSGTFREIGNKVLSLRPFVDVVFLNRSVFFLTMAGEKLFNMERSYRAICHDKVLEIIQSDVVMDVDAFKSVATSGHNPRKFVAFNAARLAHLMNPEQRDQIALKFSLPLENGKVDTRLNGVSEKLVKLLCNKGMVDPFEDVPVEVSGSKKWQ